MEDQANWVVGRRAVEEALAQSPERVVELCVALGATGRGPAQIINLAKAAGIKVRKVDGARLEAIAEGAQHQGVALRLTGQGYSDFEQILDAARQAGPAGLVVVADHIQDPHNLGAIIRSAAAAGAQGVVVPKDRACPLTPAVGKAAAGALARVMVARVTNLTQALEACQSAGLWAVAAATREAPAPWELDLTGPLALVVGGEHTGVGARLAKACDFSASLPLAAGVESLNASVAAGVLLFEIVRQRAQAVRP